MKTEWLLPNYTSKSVPEFLLDIKEYFGLSHYGRELTNQEIEKLFASKHAYAEAVRWPGWRLNRFYGVDEYDQEVLYDMVHITIYGAIGPLDNSCLNCGTIYRYLDISDLAYKCHCEIDKTET